ncbi:hypothetical protein MBLNU457_6843t1 [Dothideomycetes sp. NU457]
MMSSGFTNAPITRTLIIASITLSILASLTDNKPFLPLSIRPHLVSYAQFWRLLSWPVAYTSSSSVLFSSMTLYNLRIIERLWSSRKFLSFIVSTAVYTTLLPPLALVILHIISLGRINTLPSGPTAVVFALLAQYHAAIPYSYKYNISWPLPPSTNPSSSTPNASSSSGVILTSKATTYLLPLQLALSSLPGSAIAAAIGWLVGYAYRLDLLPGATTWRVPDLAGKRKERERFEGLRRRMEGEVGAGTGTDNAAAGTTAGGARRRGVAGSILDQFRGVF